MAKVKVRIAVAINERGQWYASGCTGDSRPQQTALDGMEMFDLATNEVVNYVEAEIDIPESKTVQGNTKREDPWGHPNR